MLTPEAGTEGRRRQEEQGFKGSKERGARGCPRGRPSLSRGKSTWAPQLWWCGPKVQRPDWEFLRYPAEYCSEPEREDKIS